MVGVWDGGWLHGMVGASVRGTAGLCVGWWVRGGVRLCVREMVGGWDSVCVGRVGAWGG